MKWHKTVTTILFAVLLFGSIAPTANAQERPSFVSPEVHEDGRVTIRMWAPKAERVLVNSGEIETVLDKPNMIMAKDDRGVWSVTLGPIPPGIYDYAIAIDGANNTDPLNPNVFGNRQGSRGYLEVPGPEGKPRTDEWQDVPHGSMTMHWYNSTAADGARRRIHVYTPPDYYANSSKTYPVVYLFHGSGDNDSHWMWMGRSNVIADNLIAEGKCVPAIIVMPDGHVPVPRRDNEDRMDYRERANGAFEKDIIENVMPLVNSVYRIKPGRENCAVVGLSMGGGQSLRVGLSNLDRFAWIGGFSSSARRMESIVEKLGANSKETNDKISLLWIAIGKDDFLLDVNHQFIQSLKDKQIDFEYHETEGRHQWSVWRRYLAEFLPRLFERS